MLPNSSNRSPQLSLVEELQAAALNRDIPVSDLLRRVKLAAAKLKLTTTLDWVESELNGYNCDDADIPSYRVGAGSLMTTTQHHGTRPAHGDAESIAALSMSYFRESISSLEALLNSGGNGHIVVPVDHRLAKHLPNYARYDVYFSKNVVASIVDTVRNLVLDWAINLEAEGILGEGVSFTMEEKKKAAEATPNVQINNYGHYHQGDVSGDQNRTVIGGDDNSSNQQSLNLFAEVRNAVETNVHGSDREVLLELIDRMDATKHTPSFREAYDQFLLAAATYMTILGPFIPALTSYISG
jgi:hypothetical protein